MGPAPAGQSFARLAQVPSDSACTSTAVAPDAIRVHHHPSSPPMPSRRSMFARPQVHRRPIIDFIAAALDSTVSSYNRQADVHRLETMCVRDQTLGVPTVHSPARPLPCCLEAEGPGAGRKRERQSLQTGQGVILGIQVGRQRDAPRIFEA